MRTIFNNKGISLVVLIVIMLGMAIIGGGVAAVMSSKQKSYPFAVNSYRAYEIANAGIEFTIAWVQDPKNENIGLLTSVNNLTNIPFGGGTFSTVISGTSPNEILTSTGTFNNVTRVVTLTNFSTYVQPSHDKSSEDPEFRKSLSPVESQADKVITVKPTGVISLGKMGKETFGAVWYGGTGVSGAPGNCVLGSCDFANGFRVYFVFQFATGSTGEGFTFAVINGAYNNAGSLGGDTSMGELMAYGGDSRRYSPNTPAQNNIYTFADHKGMGILPPKFATEFDIYHNACGMVCLGAGSRCDPSGQQHMAYVFWGDNSTMGCAPQDTSNYLKWMPSMSYALNAVVSPTTLNGSIYRAIIAGASASPTSAQSNPEPSWPPIGSGNAVTESCTTPPCVRWQEVSWVKNTSFSVGDVVAPSVANGRFYSCTKATGKTPKSGNAEPTWCTVNSCKVSDGSLEWTEFSPTFVASPPGNSRTYDDNRHAAGTGGDNGSSSGTGPTNTTTSNSYYTSPTNPTTWLADTVNHSATNPTYAFRMEVTRNSAARTYRIKSWIKQCTDVTSKPPTWTASTAYAIGAQIRPTTNYGYYYTAQTAGTSDTTEPAWTGRGTTVTDGTVKWTPVAMTDCNMYTNTSFGNTRSDYTGDTPTLDRTITLDSTYNNAFSKFLFGWTVATSAETQIVDVWKFGLSFKP